MPKNALLSRVLRQNQQNCAFCPHFSGRRGLLRDLGTDLSRILHDFHTLCPVFYVFSHNLFRILRGIPYTLAKHTKKMSLEAPFEHSGGLLPKMARIGRQELSLGILAAWCQMMAKSIAGPSF